jgi:vancomycin aglycone glucosyltransferase
MARGKKLLPAGPRRPLIGARPIADPAGTPAGHRLRSALVLADRQEQPEGRNMKIAIVIYGTRGDVQPMLALALALKKRGHEVVLCAPPENAELVQGRDCPFVPVGSSVKEHFQGRSSQARAPRTQPSVQFMRQEIRTQLEQLPDILRGSTLVLGVGYVLGVPTVAEYLHIPYRFVAFYPAILGAPSDAPWRGRLLWRFGRTAVNLFLRGFLNKARRGLALEPIADVWAHWMGPRVIVASDVALGAVPEGVEFPFTQTGYLHLEPNGGLNEEIERFLRAGPAPVFIGFGSNPIHHPEKMGRLLVDVSQGVQQRFIISRGWAGLTAMEGRKDCLFVDDVPYELLFPRVAAVVHHGGTGTEAAAARAGVPQMVFPFMADQFENRKYVVQSGLGPRACDFKKLSAERLSQTISDCLSNEQYRQNAERISHIIQGTDGIVMTLRALERELGPGAGL